jgi:short subunit dehydrogenase-like uncharacterized protein
MAKRFDVVLLGPTGVTGREVARYLAERAPELDVRWAVAGRDEARVRASVEGLASAPVDVLHADTSDATSIDAVARSTRVVANLVGPYARHGEVVYAACARHGTHEIDLTGEIDWLRTMIDRYDGSARASGAKLVPTAGFEALPFDLGALLAARTVHERSGEGVTAVDVAVTITPEGRLAAISDAVSGGTFTSGVELLKRGPGRATTDAYFLDPPEAAGIGAYDLGARRHPGTGQWLAPMFPSAFLNPPIAHRSAALLRQGGDRTFAASYRYREGIAVGAMAGGPKLPGAEPVLAVTMAALQGGFGLLTRAPGAVRGPVADALLRFGPKAGEGPRPETLDAWHYRLDVRATTTGGSTADVVVEARGHPGYKSTATMVGEAALVLADGGEMLPEGSGFLTPATALGTELLDRFAPAGVTFRVTG